MALRFWHFGPGYVMITIRGVLLEQLLTAAHRNQIRLWGVRRKGAAASLWVRAEEVRACGALCRRYHCRFRIEKKCGLPFWLKKLRRRPVFLLGVALFLVLLNMAGLFCWRVEVEGVEGRLALAVEDYCRSEGLYPGAFLPTLDGRAFAEGLLTAFPELEFAAIHTSGATCTVEVASKLPLPPRVDRDSPADVVARYDGVVTEVAVSAGTALVAPGDVVQAGETLISGKVIQRDGLEEVGAVWTHAAGNVTAHARLVWEKTETCAFSASVPTGEKRYGWALNWFGHQAAGGAAEREGWQKTGSRTFSLPALPAEVTVTRYEQQQTLTGTRTLSQVRGRLWVAAQTYLQAIAMTEGEVLAYELDFSPAPGGLTARLTATVALSIGEERAITQTEEWTENE